MEKDAYIDKSTSGKSYRIITDCLRREIEAGNYKHGERLPSEKELGIKFTTSRSVVREALSALEYVGLIEVRGGSGYYVSGNVPVSPEEMQTCCAAKMICTIDDNWKIKTLKALFERGVDGVILMLSTENQQEWPKRYRMIQQAAHDTHSTLAVMAHIFADTEAQIRELTTIVATAKVDGIILNIIDQDVQKILEVRRVLDSLEANVLVFAQISSVNNEIEDVLRVTDGLIIAGTLLTEDRNNTITRELVAKCNLCGKIIFAYSIIRQTVPMSGNSSDFIVKAVLTGFDGVMVTMEANAQKFPLDAVQGIYNAAKEAELCLEVKNEKRTGRVVSSPILNALCMAAIQAAVSMKAKAFIVPSETGFTPRLLAKLRQTSPIIAISPHIGVVRQLKLVWGVRPLLSRHILRQEDIIQLSVDTALKANYLSDGDSIVGVVGNMDIPNAYNAVKLIVVGDIILKGQGIGDGIISGRVTIIKTLFDINKRVKNKIVVVKATEAEHIGIIKEAAALIVEEGGLSSHAAITCLTLGKPVIVGAEDAVDLLLEDEQVTVDVMRGVVYRGWVNLG